ncbi:MAG: thiolase family protein, partial [Planctomycetota bacterium]
LAVIQGARAIERGESALVVAGGTESMSRLPYYLERARTGYRLGHGELVDGMYRDGFQCPLADQLMGATAETLAGEFSIPREEQDAYAAESQRRCEAARKAGRFDAELVPLEVPARKGSVVVDRDEHPRDGVTAAGLAKLPPVFKKEGTVHAGNSSGITDGAAALLIASEEKARELGLEPLALIGASTRAGVDPRRMGMGPVPAVRRLLEATGGRLDDFDLIELNEAFAAQVLACDRELHLDRERLNVNGGAIALGHPIGATGARIVVTLLQEMLRRDAGRGLATLCISGGMGLALELIRSR